MLKEINIPSPLLVSCPNNGGLVFLYREKLLTVSNRDVTGLSLADGEYILACQYDGARSLRKLAGGKSVTVELSGERLDLHDVLICENHIYAVLTEHNQVIKLDKDLKIERRWTLPGEPDSSHINSIVLYRGRLLASLFGRFGKHREYKGRTKGSGEIIDIDTGETFISGLSQPHSLTVDGGLLYLCNSEDKELRIYDDSRLVKRIRFSDYTRGIAIDSDYLYVGLSLSRNIDTDKSSLQGAAVVVLERKSFRKVGVRQLPFKEIYDIALVRDYPNLIGLVEEEWSRDKAKNSVLQGELRKSNERLEGLLTEIVVLRESNKRHIETERQTKAELSARSEEAVSAKNAAELLKQEILYARKIHEQEMARVRQASGQEIASAGKTIELLRNEIADSRKTYERESALIRQTFHEMEGRLREDLKKRENEIESSRKTIDELRSETVGAGKIINQLVADRSRLEGVLQARTDEVGALRGEIEALNFRLQEDGYTIAKLEAEIRKLSEMNESHKKAEEGLRRELDLGNAKIENYETIIGDNGKKISTLSISIRDKEKEIADLNNKLRAISSSVAELNSRLDRGRLEILRLQEMHKHESERLMAVKRSISWRLTSPLRCVSRRLKLLKKRIQGRNAGLRAADVAMIRRSELFNAGWYLDRYPDVRKRGTDPVKHYLQFGAREWRDPGPEFCTKFYLNAYPDISRAGINPLLHYIKRGRAEGRLCKPPENAKTKPVSDPGSEKNNALPVDSMAGSRVRAESSPTVLVCAHSAGSNLFGGELSFLDILDGLIEAGYNVLVTLPSGANAAYAEELKKRSIELLSFRYGWWRKGIPVSESVIGTFANIMINRRVDAVHVNTIMLREPLIAARRARIPSLVHVRELIKHDPDLFKLIGESPDEIIKQVTGAADYIVANSETTSRMFWKPDSTFIIPNPIDHAVFDIENNIEHGIINIGLVSSNLPKKGIYDFVEVAKLLKDEAPEARFLLIGPKNDYIKELEEKQKKGQLPGNIIFSGYQESPVRAIEKVNIVMNLSHFQESFGRSVLEAMAASRPVVAYDWGALSELIVNGGTGFLVPFQDVSAAADKIKWICLNPGMVRSMGSEGRRVAIDKYSKAKYSECMARAYSRILGKAGPGVGNPGGGLVVRARDLGKEQVAQKPGARVSVVIPNYNYSRFLKERIESITNQSYRPHEIIFLDDASTDDSVIVARALLEKSPIPYVLIENKKNAGTYAQWMRGIKEARGDFVWIAEADDSCRFGFLETLVNEAIASNSGLVYCQSSIIDANGLVVKERNLHHTDDLSAERWKSDFRGIGLREVLDYLFYRNSIPNVSACLLRRELLAGCEESILRYRFCGDWYLYCHVLEKGNISYVEQPLNLFRRHGGSVTRSNTRKMEYLEEIIGLKKYIVERFPVHEKQLARMLYFLDKDFKVENLKKNSDTKAAHQFLMETRSLVRARKRMAFLTTNNGSYNGGSEVLWVDAARRMRDLGHDVVVVIKKWDPPPAFFAEFSNKGIKILFKGEGEYEAIAQFAPDLMVISLGDQDEGTDWYQRCGEAGIPYVIVNQLTKEARYWPIVKNKAGAVKEGYLGARKVFFTSENNHRVMESRLGCTIPNAGIHYNPFHMDRDISLPFPSTEEGLKIAMPARLLMIHKGQHLAIELLASEKWRSRNLVLNLYGEGPDEGRLRALVEKHDLRNIFFYKRVPNVLEIWKQNHAILMPSFMEGLPIVLVGAMVCARVPIVTDVGGHREVIDDNVEGFIAAEPSVEALDDALERAYGRRGDWESIGRRARDKILRIVPEDPVEDFVKKVLACAGQPALKVQLSNSRRGSETNQGA